MFDAFADGPQILVGSSMGGWLALLLAKRLRERGETDRLAGMVLIAPAVDMTKDLMWDLFDEAARRALAETGLLRAAFGLFRRALRHHPRADRGRRTAISSASSRSRPAARCTSSRACRTRTCPGAHATTLMERLAFDDAVLTLVRDGDHRLSRPEDIERLIRAVEEMIAG